MSPFLERLLRGGPHRRTRFHDEKGNLVDPVGILYAPLAFATAAMKVAFGFHSKRPMISYRAARRLDSLIEPGWKIVEFGSGYSTLWLARRCRFLLSIEDDQNWHARIARRLAREGLQHVRHEFRGTAEYADLTEFADGYFDLALIDGSVRAACVASVIPKIRTGGWVYLDNSDKDVGSTTDDMRRAEATLLDAVKRRNGTTRYFTDFAPTNFFVEQGLLARL